MNRVVALKVIREELLADTEVLGRFYREIQVLSQLDHPNIVHAFDAGPAGPTHFLAMEFVEGTDLGRLVKRGGPMPVEQACAYVRQAACGLGHAHERGLVHRDIKPHNLIMSVRDGLIKVADLGLARLPRTMSTDLTAALSGVKGTGTLTPENAGMMGTADYLAPEQALDFHKADIRADIYSLGCTFYYLLTGQPPFPGATLAEKLVKHQQAKPPRLQDLRKDLPSGLAAVVHKMLAKRPEQRYQTPAEVVDALNRFSRAASAAGWRHSGLLGRCTGLVVSLGQRRRLLLGLGGLLLLGMAAFLLFRSASSRSSMSAGPRLERLVEGRYPDLPREVVAVLSSPGKREPIGQVAFSPDGSWLATGDSSGRIRLWDGSGTERKSLKDLPQEVRGLVFTPDSKALIYAMPAVVKRWEIAQAGEPATVFTSEGDPQVVKLALSADGKSLASGHLTGIVRMWDVAGNRERFNLKGAGLLAFTPDSHQFLGSSDNRLLLRDIGTGAEKAALPMDSAVRVSFAPGGQVVALGSHGNAFKLWDISARQQLAAVNEDLLCTMCLIAFTPDAKWIVRVAEDGNVSLWDSRCQNKKNWKLPHGMISGALAPDGRHVAVGNLDGNTYIIRLPTMGKE